MRYYYYTSYCKNGYGYGTCYFAGEFEIGSVLRKLMEQEGCQCIITFVKEISESDFKDIRNLGHEIKSESSL